MDKLAEMIELQTNRQLEPCPLELRPLAGPPSQPLSQNVLACLQFGTGSALSNDPRVVPIELKVHRYNSGWETHRDLWISSLPIKVGVTDDGIRHADNGAVLFGWMCLAEEELKDIEQAACDLHVRLHRFLRQRGYPHWLRAWNYLSFINEGKGDFERYRQFTAGRYRGLMTVLADTPHFERKLPAATAIGTRSSTGWTVCFFAGRRAGIQVENPRQTSAFEYPRLYGPRSPSFSRATLQHWRDRSVLFVSGTASIVGHATQHRGDVLAQFEETLCNLDVLLRHAADEHFQGQRGGQFQPRAFKLYVRDSHLLAQLEPRCHQALSSRAPTTLLIADLCRSDLLVEVEAVYEWEHS